MANKTMSFVGRSLTISAGIMFILLLCIILGGRIPPYDMTITRMSVLKTRVLKYLKTHAELPDNIEDLPKREGYGNSVKDGWGGKIQVRRNSERGFTFISLGRDGKPGGTAKDSDITFSFEVNNGEGDYDMLIVGDEIKYEYYWNRVPEGK